MNNSLNKVQKVSRNLKLSPMSRDTDLSFKRNHFFPYAIEDTSIDFTHNIELSPSHTDSSLPNSLKSIKVFATSKGFIKSKNLELISPNNFEKNFKNDIKNDYYYNKGSKNFTISLFEKKNFVMTEKNRKNLKLYQVWPSNNRFLFKGRMIFGPKSDNCHYLFVLFLIFGITIAFCILVIPYLWTDISPILPCFIIYLFITTIVFLLLTTFTDPGIIPKKKVFDLFGGVPSCFMENAENSDVSQSRNSSK